MARRKLKEQQGSHQVQEDDAVSETWSAIRSSSVYVYTDSYRITISEIRISVQM